jgi:enediyne biosynthesis protein E4
MARLFLFALAALFAPQTPLDGVLDHAATPEKRLIETMPGGVALLDYDGDGRLDVFLAGAAGPNRLYRNAGGRRFADVSAAAGIVSRGYSMGVAAGDSDGDGHMDLFVAGVSGHLLLRNNGQGRFEDATRKAGLGGEQPWSVAAGWFDYDRDGDLDLFVVRYVDWSPAKERFCGDPVRKIRQYCHPRFFSPLSNALYRNRGDGTFEDVSTAAGIAAHKGKGMSLAFLDADEDGFPDVFVTNDTEPNFLFRNDGGKRFTETALAAGVALPESGRPVSAMGIAAGDLDNDGRTDLAFTALMGETFPVLFSTGKAAFADRTYRRAWRR